MKIKAISVWQPWASLIASGAKRYETRSWETSYRGSLLICSSLSRKGLDSLKEIRSEAKKFALPDPIPEVFFYPLGTAVCVADLTFIYLTAALNQYLCAAERILGDFSPGRYAWKLDNVQAIEPFPVKGKQGLFDVEVAESQIRLV